MARYSVGPLARACALVLFGLVLTASALPKNAPSVAIYMSEANGVLDLSWSKGPKELLRSLQGIADATAVAEQPNLADDNAPDVYVIPSQNGNVFYSSAEDMNAIASFVVNGGLVVVSSGQEGSLPEFISKALNYEGNWLQCKSSGSNERTSFGSIKLSPHASAFLDSQWPERLEDARALTASTWCLHEDTEALTYPLYTVEGDENKVVAQAFGKVGTAGAVVYLAYSWKDGAQEGWASLLEKIVNDFANGAYVAAPAPHHFDKIDSVLEATNNIADEASEVVRRFLQTAAVSYPPSPSPSPSPSPAPRPPLYVDVVMMPGDGTKGTQKPVKSVVWYDDEDFTEQKKGFKPLQLVDRNKKVCPAKCAGCLQSWKATGKQLTVAIFFKEPRQITKISIKQVKGPGIGSVQFLKWSFPPIGDVAPTLLGAVVRNVTSDNTNCTDVLTINVPDSISGINSLPVPRGSQSDLKPRRVSNTAAGGVIITVVRPEDANSNFGPFIEWVKFDGRVLYPQDPSIYAAYLPVAAGTTR